MARLKQRSTVLATVAGVAVAGGLAFALAGNPAQAEAPTPAPSSSAPSSSAPATGADKPDRETVRAQRRDELAGALATELGIDKAKVAAALEKVQSAQQSRVQADRIADLKARLEAAVAAGKITEAESAAILKAAEAGVLPQGGPGGRGGWPGGRHGR